MSKVSTPTIGDKEDCINIYNELVRRELIEVREDGTEVWSVTVAGQYFGRETVRTNG